MLEGALPRPSGDLPAGVRAAALPLMGTYPTPAKPRLRLCLSGYRVPHLCHHCDQSSNSADVLGNVEEKCNANFAVGT